MNKNKINLTVLAGLFAALTAIGAFLKIPFYPVPFTLQTFFTALAGLVLPARWAAASQLVYVIIGLIGLPVFANGGGIAYVMQPTFGYLLFLPITAYVIAWMMSRKSERTLVHAVAISSLGSFITLVGGALWLYVHLIFIVEKSVSFAATFYSGMIMFLPAMLLKSLLAGFIWQAWKKRIQ